MCHFKQIGSDRIKLKYLFPSYPVKMDRKMSTCKRVREPNSVWSLVFLLDS